MLVFSALVPHPPISLPAIGGAHVKKIEQTRNSFLTLEQELYAAKPDSLIIIGNHGTLLKEAFTINQRPNPRISFQRFGNLTDTRELTNDIALGYKIKEALEVHLPISLTENSELNFAIGVPLWHMLKKIPTVKIVPIGYSALSAAQHYSFGAGIRKVIENLNTRVAAIASAEIKVKGEDKQRQIAELIKSCKLSELTELSNSSELPAEVNSVFIIQGLLRESNIKSQLLSFESPFGAGYLIINFQLA